ncbi:MAG: hypothetical protein K940chlam9_00948 [Chlamydiae bacterium]|nr:hypothetical protein [Chlamydiota bacterium]
MNGNFSFFHMALLFWIIMDPVGNLPIFVSLLKHLSPQEQRKVISREMVIALLIILLFLFFGHGFFSLFQIDEAAMELTGGIILFLIALQMVFSSPDHEKKKGLPKDPFIVPLAVPAVAGPAILATITLYSASEVPKGVVMGALILAWALTLPILLFAPYLKKWLGNNGIIATERLFGYIVVLIAAEMSIEGLTSSLT